MKRLSTVFVMLLLSPCLAIADSLPDTGQTKCYDDTQEITCPQPGVPFYGQDAQYVTSPRSYTKLDANGNDLPDNTPWPWAMVRDNVTELKWEMKTDDDSIHDKDNTYTWEQAMEFGTTLNAVQFGGCSDWLLPSIKELSGIVDNSVPSPGPTINTDYFPNTLSSFYWSSTPSISNSDYVWIVHFNNGFASSFVKSRNRSVMAVCGGQSGSSGNFIDNDDGTVTDTDTDLMWQQATAPERYSWEQALSYCESLNFAEYNDWRLPNRNELQTLVDYDQYNPSINVSFFSDTMSFFYWSSTTTTDNPDIAWCINFNSGSINDTYHKTSENLYLRCMRGGVDCEGNFDCDLDCDGADASAFKADFGRSPFKNPCTNPDPCNGDFDCDMDVDGTDASVLKDDFGRSGFKNPCPNCEGDEGCSYP